jgi:NADH:ubiquinone oxidoreductase subunit 6 (subunit J)
MMYRINETEMDILYNKWIQTTWFPVLVLPTVCVIGMILDTIILTYSQHIQYMYSTVYNMLNEHVYHIYNNSTLCELSSTSNINTLGDLLFTWYMYPLIIAAFFLFFVVIVCINLILKHSN